MEPEQGIYKPAVGWVSRRLDQLHALGQRIVGLMESVVKIQDPDIENHVLQKDIAQSKFLEMSEIQTFHAGHRHFVWREEFPDQVI